MKRKMTNLVVRFAWWLFGLCGYDPDYGGYWEDIGAAQEQQRDDTPVDPSVCPLTQGIVPGGPTL